MLSRQFAKARSSWCRRAFLLKPKLMQELSNSDINSRPLIPNELRQQRREGILVPPTLPAYEIHNYELERLRVVPSLPTFYGGNPIHEQNLNMLNGLIRKYINLPTRVMSDKDLQEHKFVSFEEYKKRVDSGTRLKPIHHKELVQLLHRLRSIEPELMPQEVSTALKDFASVSSEMKQAAKKMRTLDEFGRAIAIGRRKSSSAKVYLVRGEGGILVNGKPFIDYFPKSSDRRKVVYPFQVVSQEGEYNVFAKVEGGGTTGQADAIMYGIAKALVIFNELLKTRLHKVGLMTRDARVAERKKPGKVKARKSPTWVKR